MQPFPPHNHHLHAWCFCNNCFCFVWLRPFFCLQYLGPQLAFTCRSAAAHSRPLSPVVAPALAQPLASAISQVITTFPAAATCLAAQLEREGGHGPHALPATVPAQVQQQLAGAKALAAVLAAGSSSSAAAPGGGGGVPVQLSSRLSSFASLVMRPRLLICGPPGSGQEHLAAALLHALEGLPVHALGLPSLLSDPGARSLEEAVVHAVVEARRAAPAILFLPHLHVSTYTHWCDLLVTCSSCRMCCC